jgi:sulfatase modifying factor 1
VTKLLSKDPAGRPASARAVAAALQAIERGLPGHGAVPVAAVPAPTLAQAAAAPVRRRRRPRIAIAAGVLAAAALVAGIVVIIRDQHGKEVARVTVPGGGSVEIKDEAKQAPTPRGGVRIEPEPLAPLPPGEPLSRFALVRQPARLPGVRSWTIERREAWIPSALAFRPDGKRLAVAGHDGAIRVWEPPTGRLVQLLLGNGLALSLAWSPDGQVLAIGGWLGRQSVQLWDAETGRLLRSLETEPDDTFTALAFAPDGRTLLGWAGKKGGCLAWDAAGGKLRRRVPIPFEVAAFSPDAKQVAGPQANNRVSIRDTETGKELAHLNAPAPVWHLAWSPDGKRLAGTGQDGLSVWDPQSAAKPLHRKDAVRPGPDPAWSPDGRTVAYTLEDNGGVALVEAVEGAEPRRLDDPGNSAVAWSPDGKTIARISGWPWVLLYDAATGKRLRTLSWGSPVRGFAWSPEGPAAALSEYGQTSLWSLDPGQVTAVLKDTSGASAWSPDGKAVATGGPNNTVLVWESGGELRLTLAGHQQDVTSLAWSPDGKRLASAAAGEKRVLLWDPQHGERAGEVGPFPGRAEALTWSPGGRLLAFNVPDLGWHVWDVGQGKLVNDPGEWKAVRFAFAPDGRTALAAPNGGEPYRLRELTTGKERGRLPVAARSYLGPPAWSPDGRLLAVPTDLPGVELWRGDLARRVRTLRGADWNADEVAFSRDGKLVVGQLGDRLQIWEADTGRLRGLLFLGEGNNGLAITPDGHYTGTDRVERGIVMVVQKDDGTQELLEPAEFEEKYGFRNDPARVRLTAPAPAGNSARQLPPPQELIGLTSEQAGRKQQEAADALGVPVAVRNGIGLKVRLIPAGRFWMGSPESEPGRQANEGPRHLVTISRPFYLGACEVTVGQFRAFVRETDYKTGPETNGRGAYRYEDGQNVLDPKCTWRAPGHEQGDAHPAVCVSWADAVAFCEWLSHKEGRTYRLPTEAEWEFACRAGTSTAYFFGDDPASLSEYAWTGESGRQKSHPVGLLRPNPWGLYDILGNGWEWCLDGGRPYAPEPVSDPRGPGGAANRVIRGGSFHPQDSPAFYRSAFRWGALGRNDGFANQTFRVLCELGSKAR